ncbi:chemotaxis protein CheA [Nocardioides sp. Root1257]|uniref:chemotaxis protein CheW n=1 Tax=unclassified Nocardioides TaxID=2615069 RepID=UPI0006F6957D|nr:MULTISPECIES: chemotaxis protein CheW [unclassified Nocardioides]KQW46082.1 chemotaxis protein CheA [Nocardioides sp. Root1257]KRC43344.1 chemotaxis protein CheA [Nocardioides sp. Root224]
MDEIDEIVQEFLVESHENLDQLDRDLVALEREPGSRDLLGSIFRTIHTIKGTSGFLAFGQLESVTHVGENLLARLRDGKMSMSPQTTDVLLAMVDTVRDLLATIEQTGGEGDTDVSVVVGHITAILDGKAPEPVAAPAPEPVAEPVVDLVPEAPVVPALVPVAQAPVAAEPVVEHEDPVHRRTVADSSIRVDVDLLDTLMRLVGELVLTRNQIVRQAGDQQDVDLMRSSQRLNLIASELQEGVMKTRMQPIDNLWSKLPRVVRDLGANCGKQVSLTMVGKETELDRTLLEAVKDPLTHLVRNGVDHGLESPEDRVAAGKPAEGVLTLRAYHQGGQVVVEVSDDGAGIDSEKVAAKAVERGLRTQAQIAQMSPTDVLQLIFVPGFSTAAAVTNVSGRGVGMDVVKTNIEGIGGTIEVESVVGRGTTCRLRIPLTLAIVPALTVECAGDRYAIPQVSLLELVSLDADRAANAVEDINGASVYRLRGTLLPLVRLAEVLGVESDRSDGHVVIAVLQAEGKRFGLVIDRVLSTEEIVVKPLGSQMKAIGTYSGATILGDGRVALILDVQALARRVLNADALELDDTDDHDTRAVTAESLRLLVAGLGGGRKVAIPLSSVTRLENFDQSAVERIGNREVVQYRGGILPVVRLNNYYGAISDREGDELVVVIYTVGDRSVAIAVDEIVDIVDENTEFHAEVTDHGVLGSTLVRDRIVEVLDVRAAILSADPTFYTASDEFDAELQETM